MKITTDKSMDTGPYLHVYEVKVILPAKTRLYSPTLNKQLSYVLKFHFASSAIFDPQREANYMYYTFKQV